MEFPNSKEIEKSLFTDDGLVLPSKVRDGIEQCLVSSASEIYQAKEQLSSTYKDYVNPPKIDYENAAIIDAYTVDYLPRNFFIPQIAFRDLALCDNAVLFNKTIRILDLGSGTGAVALGVFELFSKAPFYNHFNIELIALDFSIKALQRQRNLRVKSGLNFTGDEFDVKHIDLKDVAKVAGFLATQKPWDVIFSGNFMNELDPKSQEALIDTLSMHLAKNGSIIIAEPAQDRSKKILAMISAYAKKKGLTIYYPCNEKNRCSKSQCWIWREYRIDAIRHIEKEVGIITFSDKPLLISVIILNKNGASIFDAFKELKPKLKWDIIAPVRSYGDEYELCNRRFRVEGKRYKRGALVGWKELNGEIIIEHYKEL
jgi:SAM-dependent methyltransferase